MIIKDAATALSRDLFGSFRSLDRLGGVHIEDGFLVVHTRIPEAKWPEDRATQFEGFPVNWRFVGKPGDPS